MYMKAECKEKNILSLYLWTYAKLMIPLIIQSCSEISYLRDRQHCVKVGGAVSDRATVNISIPQGSILGCMLFSVYVNDILWCQILSGQFFLRTILFFAFS